MAYTNLALSPTVIDLSSLPNTGRVFTYTEKSAELTPFLKDLVGTNPYRVEIELRPIGNAYSAQGSIETELDELCSLCAIEFKQPVRERFNEVLVIGATPSGHGAHQARVNHASELNASGPECTELSSEQFAIGEFIHELVALSRPMKPLGKPNCDESCTNYQEAVQNGWLTQRNEAGFQKESPFAKLRNLKLNS